METTFEIEKTLSSASLSKIGPSCSSTVSVCLSVCLCFSSTLFPDSVICLTTGFCFNYSLQLFKTCPSLLLIITWVSYVSIVIFVVNLFMHLFLSLSLSLSLSHTHSLSFSHVLSLSQSVPLIFCLSQILSLSNSIFLSVCLSHILPLSLSLCIANLCSNLQSMSICLSVYPSVSFYYLY